MDVSCVWSDGFALKPASERENKTINLSPWQNKNLTSFIWVSNRTVFEVPREVALTWQTRRHNRKTWYWLVQQVLWRDSILWYMPERHIQQGVWEIERERQIESRQTEKTKNDKGMWSVWSRSITNLNKHGFCSFINHCYYLQSALILTAWNFLCELFIICCVSFTVQLLVAHLMIFWQNG